MFFEEKYELIRKLARDLAQKELTREVQDKIEDTGEFPQEIRDKMASAGFMGIKIPKEYGGMGGDTLSWVIVMEEIARASAVASLHVAGANSLGSGPFLASGSEEQKKKYLPLIASGKINMAFGLTEPGAGSDAGGLTTYAVKDGDDYILNGRKTFISGAPDSAYAVIFARTDPDRTKGAKGISAFIMDMHASGVSCGKPEHKMGCIGCSVSDIIMENVRVPAKEMLGPLNKGFTNAMKSLDIGRIGVAAQSIGVAQSCMDETIKYVRERRQFGRPIAKFQNTQFMIADMATKLAAAKELVYQAAITRDRLEHGDHTANSTLAASMAKYYAAETCNEIAAKAVQLHGGYGYSKEYRIERLYRDCRVYTIYEGTSQIQQMVISGQLLK